MYSLRPFQKEALEALFNRSNQHVVCVSPTGSGKTRIVEEWVKNTKKKTLFISPLSALNRQQEERFIKNALHFWIDVKTPEAIQSRSFGLLVQNYDQIVIDECHTVFEWGDSFRPALRKLPTLFSKHKTLWLTATFLPIHYEKLVQELGQRPKLIGQFSFDEKIKIVTLNTPWSGRLDMIHRVSEHYGSLGVVFCNSRQWCERIQLYLKARGLSVTYYHAGLSKEERLNIEFQMKNGEISLLISTIAFGLGMHIPEIKWGMCWGFPGSFLSLTQMIGRVGRSKEGGSFYFLWSEEDESVWRGKEVQALTLGLKKSQSLREIIESVFRSVQTQ